MLFCITTDIYFWVIRWCQLSLALFTMLVCSTTNYINKTILPYVTETGWMGLRLSYDTWKLLAFCQIFVKCDLICSFWISHLSQQQSPRSEVKFYSTYCKLVKYLCAVKFVQLLTLFWLFKMDTLASLCSDVHGHGVLVLLWAELLALASHTDSSELQLWKETN